jgi:hypothetical protein
MSIVKNVKISDRAHYLLKLAAAQAGTSINEMASKALIECCTKLLGPTSSGRLVGGRNSAKKRRTSDTPEG